MHTISNIINKTNNKIKYIYEEISKEIRDEYLKRYKDNDPSKYLEYAKGWHYLIFKYIDKISKNAKTALDVGSLFGSTSIYLSKSNIITTSLDGYVDDIPDTLKLKYHLNFNFVNLEDVFPPLLPKNYYDIIVMSEVLEHLNYNPIPPLVYLRSLLKSNGKMIITTPDNDNYPPIENSPVARRSHFLKIPTYKLKSHRQSFPHSKQYDESEFRELLQTCGFNILEILKYEYQGIHFITVVSINKKWNPKYIVKKIIKNAWGSKITNVLTT